MRRALWLALAVILVLSSALVSCKAKLEDLSYADIALGGKLTGFASYRLHTVTRLEQNGETSSYDFLMELVREPAAQRLIFGATDEGAALEMLLVDDVTYINSDDEWTAMQAADQSLAEAAEAWSPEEFVRGDRARLLGKETVNGVETKHYVYEDPTGFAFTGVTEAQADVWVSTEYGVAVRTVVDITGTDENGDSTLHLESNLTDINKPIVIRAPEGVDKPGLPDDIALIEGAEDVNAMAGFINFSVDQTVDQVIAFYRAALEDEGWEPVDAGVPGMLSGLKDTRTVSVMVSAQGSGSQVMITIVDDAD